VTYKDREASLAYQRDYWAKNKDRRNAQRRQRRQEDPQASEVQSLWRRSNAERVNRDRKVRYSSDSEYRETLKARARAHGATITDKKRWYDRSVKYGISKIQARYIDYIRYCQATGVPLSNEGRQKALDHDHLTGKIRGVVDTKVNLAMGLLGDDPKKFRAVADYLERSSLPNHRWDAL
jgi:hypothetical protein